MKIPVVENPRKRTARKTSKRSVARRRTYAKPARRKRRRNPTITTLSNPRRRRRRSNPRGGLFGFNFKQAGMLSLGMVASKYVPSLISRYTGLSTTGVTGYALRVGSVMLSGMIADKMFGGRNARDLIVTGGLALIMFEAFNAYIGPSLGLSGYVPMNPSRPMYNGMLSSGGVGRYLPNGAATARSSDRRVLDRLALR